MEHTGETEAAAAPPAPWRAPLLWRFVLRLSSVLVPLVCRLRVTTSAQFTELVSRPGPGRPARKWRVPGPLVLAGNHIGNFDPVATTAACARLGITPRMMATGGLFRVPIVGAFMRAAGHIPVERGQETARNAVPDAAAALAAGSVVFIYPEGRIGLHPALWPERPRTGIARFALTTGAPVVPVAIWGSHEVIAYHGWPVMIRNIITALWRRPVVRVHFGDPVDLSDLRAGVVGHAQRASERIMDAITDELARLRADEPGLPRFRDHTRPVTLARARWRREA